MCRPTTCRTCGKTTWAGCGRHVDAVRARVTPGDWCPGDHRSSPRPSGGKERWWRRTATS